MTMIARLDEVRNVPRRRHAAATLWDAVTEAVIQTWKVLRYCCGAGEDE